MPKENRLISTIGMIFVIMKIWLTSNGKHLTTDRVVSISKMIAQRVCSNFYKFTFISVLIMYNVSPKEWI